MFFEFRSLEIWSFGILKWSLKYLILEFWSFEIKFGVRTGEFYICKAHVCRPGANRSYVIQSIFDQRERVRNGTNL